MRGSRKDDQRVVISNIVEVWIGRQDFDVTVVYDDVQVMIGLKVAM
jgi:hypothetical protein